jgi:hypothetical protein
MSPSTKHGGKAIGRVEVARGGGRVGQTGIATAARRSLSFPSRHLRRPIQHVPGDEHGKSDPEGSWRRGGEPAARPPIRSLALPADGPHDQYESGEWFEASSRRQARQRVGDRSWGQVSGSSGPLRESQATDRREPRSRVNPRKTRGEARCLRPADEHVNLHGKEAVPGSSPGEGLKPPQSGGFWGFVASAEHVEHHLETEVLLGAPRWSPLR